MDAGRTSGPPTGSQREAGWRRNFCSARESSNEDPRSISGADHRSAPRHFRATGFRVVQARAPGWLRARSQHRSMGCTVSKSVRVSGHMCPSGHLLPRRFQVKSNHHRQLDKILVRHVACIGRRRPFPERFVPQLPDRRFLVLPVVLAALFVFATPLFGQDVGRPRKHKPPAPAGGEVGMNIGGNGVTVVTYPSVDPNR